MSRALLKMCFVTCKSSARLLLVADGAAVRVGAMACGGARLVARDLRGEKQCHRPRRRAGDGGSQRRRQENSCRSRGAWKLQRSLWGGSSSSLGTLEKEAVPQAGAELEMEATSGDARRTVVVVEAAGSCCGAFEGVKQQSRKTEKEAVPQP